jgi:hypothetical protein
MGIYDWLLLMLLLAVSPQLAAFCTENFIHRL